MQQAGCGRGSVQRRQSRVDSRAVRSHPPINLLPCSNPTAWSGVSMHPVESAAYYSAMLIPVYFGAHPLVMLYTKFDLTIAAL